MTNEEFYENKIRPYAFDDTVKYNDLSFIRRILIWLAVRKFNKINRLT